MVGHIVNTKTDANCVVVAGRTTLTKKDNQVANGLVVGVNTSSAAQCRLTEINGLIRNNKKKKSKKNDGGSKIVCWAWLVWPSNYSTTCGMYVFDEDTKTASRRRHKTNASSTNIKGNNEEKTNEKNNN